MKTFLIRLARYLFATRRDLLIYSCLCIATCGPQVLKFLRESQEINRRSIATLLVGLLITWAGTTKAFLYQRTGEGG